MTDTFRIMVVDDERNIRLTTRAALETHGYQVVEAGDGEEALDQLRRSPVDLILLDLGMPLLDGIETLRHLREVGDTTPVVIVTAHGDVPDVVAAMKLGAIDYLQKPMTPDALRGVVSEVLERHGVSRNEVVAKPPALAGNAARFAEKLTRAKRAVNRLEFDEAGFFLDQALEINPRSAEVVRLMGVLRESRREHEGPYHFLRKLFS